jgi:hypothetical protein
MERERTINLLRAWKDERDARSSLLLHDLDDSIAKHMAYVISRLYKERRIALELTKLISQLETRKDPPESIIKGYVERLRAEVAQSYALRISRLSTLEIAEINLRVKIQMELSNELEELYAAPKEQ